MSDPNNTPTKPLPLLHEHARRAKALREALDMFDRECAAIEYTDTDEAQRLLKQARDLAKDIETYAAAPRNTLYDEGNTTPFIQFSHEESEASATDYVAINIRTRTGEQHQLVIDIEPDGGDEIRLYQNVNFNDIDGDPLTIPL